MRGIPLVVVSMALVVAVLAVLVVLWAEKPAEAAFPGNNGKIAFHHEPDPARDPDIYVMNPDGSRKENLTPGERGGTDPYWSADGRKIVFTSKADVFVMKPDGTEVKNLTHSEVKEANPAWSPDGTKIVFCLSGPQTHGQSIYVMKADGTRRKQLYDSPKNDCGPVWSPDSKKIAFYREGTGRDTLLVMNANGTGVKVISNATRRSFHPDWSPDGRRIVFVAYVNTNDTYDVFVTRADGTSVRNLTNTPLIELGPGGSEHWPAYSPDGTKIVYVKNTAPYGSPTIFRMNADGTGQKRLTFPGSNEYDSHPNWQPLPGAQR